MYHRHSLGLDVDHRDLDVGRDLDVSLTSSFSSPRSLRLPEGWQKREALPNGSTDLCPGRRRRDRPTFAGFAHPDLAEGQISSEEWIVMTPSEVDSSAVAATWSPIRPNFSVSDALELSLEEDSKQARGW